MRACAVCHNPRDPRLSTSQVEWHNIGHPGLEAFSRQLDTRRVRATVIIRPGDQILYEINPGKWCRVDELDVAIAAGHGVNESVARCRRCLRRLLERHPTPAGLWRSLVGTIGSKLLKSAR